MKNSKSFFGRTLSFFSFLYIIYITLRDNGYLEQIKQNIKDAHEKSKDTNESESNKEESWASVDAEDILRQRFAGGEIDTEEYNERLEVLRK